MYIIIYQTLHTIGDQIILYLIQLAIGYMGPCEAP